jgi:hypothetical protein
MVVRGRWRDACLEPLPGSQPGLSELEAHPAGWISTHQTSDPLGPRKLMTCLCRTQEVSG